MTRPLEAWDRAVRSLADDVTEAAFGTWLETVVARAQDGELRLVCPSAFHRERLRERFLPRILAALRAQGADTQVRLEVDASVGMPATRPRTGPGPGPPQRVASPRPRLAAAPDPAQRPPAIQIEASFSTFISGRSNALVREAGLAVAQGRQASMSPLYVISGPGLGKSHLASAIVLEARRASQARAVLVSAEQFTNELTKAIRERRTGDFKFRYREDLDVLVVEDVEFLQGKRATQIELFHTLDALTRHGRRIVLTADRSPRDIPDLDPRLASRMTGGLCAEIEVPDGEHRERILRAKAAAGGVRIPGDCLEVLAGAPFRSIRDLEGTLVQLVANAALLKRPLDVTLARAALRRAGVQGPRELDATEIAHEAAVFFGTSVEHLASPSRRRDVAWPRQVAMYLCHRFTPASTKEIGAIFRRGHSAVRNAIRVVERAILERATRRYQVEALIERLDPERRSALRRGDPPGDTR